ncbi:MAG: PaaI family thioesterase, partial [Thermoanaerobaculia bacterium]
YRDDLTNGSQTVHGGVLATLADTAVAFAQSTNFDGKMGFATADLTIHFLRRARGDVWARASIVKKGKRINVGDVEVVDANGGVVARALATFVLTTSSFDYAPEGKE